MSPYRNWSKPHGTPGGPGQTMKAETAAARARDCPSCGAVAGAPCIRKTDYGFLRRARYVHRARVPGYRPRHCDSCTCFQVQGGGRHG